MRLAFLLFALVSSASSAHADVHALPLAVHAGADVDVATIARWVEQTNVHFAPAGVQFVHAQTRVLPESALHLANNRDRHRLKRRLVPRHINVFVVNEIIDPWPSAATRRAAAREGFEPSGRLGGAHIPAPRHRPSTYVIVRRGSLPLVLAHELGHVLGAPHHPDPTNIMSYGRHRTHFNDEQLATFRRRARRLIRRRDVRRL
ncbi:MAG: hypothetical protein AAF411_10015 [Myxococcota bacterium]